MPASDYHVIGYVTANLGLGVAARNTIARLLDRGAGVQVIDVDPGGGRSGADRTYADLASARPGREPAIDVFHVNPPEVLAFWSQWRAGADLARSFNVCVPFWELPMLPPAWVATLECMDAVLAPSLFVLDACRAALPGATVIHYPQSIEMPAGVVADRGRWGLPEGTATFFVAFDINSDIERKNPWGAIDAFSRAFPEGEDVRLVVRLNAHGATRQMRSQIEALRARVAADDRMVLVEGEITYRDVLTLYASCDVLVSLHRSEGLGLPLMEAMSLGKPVVATAWSGNMDFMDDRSACLVAYDLIPVQAALPSYATDVIGPDQVWADPDLDAAAEWMRRLADDDAFRERMGSAARERMEQHRRYALENDPFAANERQWGASLGAAHAGRPKVARLAALLRRQRRARMVGRAKRGAVLTLRKLGLYPPGD